MSVIEGIYTVMATPFLKDESIDFDSFGENIEWLIKNNAEALLVAGALGEYASLTIDERKSLTEFALKKINGRVPVVIGTTSNRPQYVIELTNHAKDNGATGVMILPPPGYALFAEEIYEFYKKVCENINCPVMLYNNPGSSGMDISITLLSKIAKLPNICAIKESSGDIKRITAIKETIGEKLASICGWEDMCYEAFLVGAKGFVAMSGNFIPNELHEMYNAIKSGDNEKSWKIYKSIAPILHYLEDAGKPTQTCKYIMDKIGLKGGFLRLPKQPLTKEEKQNIDAIWETVFNNIKSI